MNVICYCGQELEEKVESNKQQQPDGEVYAVTEPRDTTTGTHFRVS